MLIGLLITDVLLIALGAIAYPHLPPQIPLYYSRPWGEDQIADLWFILLLPFFMHLCIGLNVFIARKMNRNSFIPKLLNTINWSLMAVTLGICIRIVAIMTL